jgi:hypothetical protein
LRKENSGKIGENRDRLRKSEKRREKEREERRENGDRRQEPVSPHFHEKRRELLFSCFSLFVLSSGEHARMSGKANKIYPRSPIMLY